MESTRVPYAPVTVTASHDAREASFEALVDTSYTGFVVVPRGSFPSGAVPFRQLELQLADNSTVLAPVYWGGIRFGQTVLTDIPVTELGGEAIIGMQVIGGFRLTIDHGRVLTLEP